MLIIAIDGPSASGKGSLGKRLANYFGLYYLDSGNFYRALAKRVVDTNINLEDHSAVISQARKIKTEELAEPSLKTEEISRIASKVAIVEEVRAIFSKMQREFIEEPGLVADGRDMGTVVFKDADLKLFLTAKAEARARRRYLELVSRGIDVSYDQIFQDIKNRDKRDLERKNSPLKKAEDAIAIDTTSMSADEVFEFVKELVVSNQISA